MRDGRYKWYSNLVNSRIPFKTEAEYPWYIRVLFKIQRKKFGVALNPFFLWGYSPLQALAFTFFYAVVDRKQSPIDPLTKSLVMVRVAQLIECRFCIDINASFLLKQSASKEKVLGLEKWQDSVLYTEKEKLALRYAEFMTLNPAQVEESLVAQLRQTYGDAGVVELTGIISYQNLSARFNSALNVPPQGFCELKPNA